MDLNDPTLTHIVFDKRDTTRRLELIKRERSRPRQRRFIVSDFFEACLDEATLLNEEGKCYSQEKIHSELTGL